MSNSLFKNAAATARCMRFLRALFIVLSAGMVALALGAGAVRPAPARAAGAITFDGSPGTGAPPPTLGPYTMQRFDTDPRPLNTIASGVTGPTGQVGFAPALLYVGGKGSNFPAADSYYTGNLGNLYTRSGIGATSMSCPAFSGQGNCG